MSLSLPPKHVQIFHRYLTGYEILLSIDPAEEGLATSQVSCCGEEFFLPSLPLEDISNPSEVIKQLIIVTHKAVVTVITQQRNEMLRNGYVRLH